MCSENVRDAAKSGRITTVVYKLKILSQNPAQAGQVGAPFLPKVAKMSLFVFGCLYLHQILDPGHV